MLISGRVGRCSKVLCTLSDVFRSGVSSSILQNDWTLHTILRCRPSSSGTVSVCISGIIVVFIFLDRIWPRFRRYSFRWHHFHVSIGICTIQSALQSRFVQFDWFLCFIRKDWVRIVGKIICHPKQHCFHPHRIPKVLNSQQDIIRQCTSQTMTDGNFCDYQEFDNSEDGNSLVIRITNDFDEEMIEFWDDIFEIAQRKWMQTSIIAKFWNFFSF